jgi:hypothetical protein
MDIQLRHRKIAAELPELYRRRKTVLEVIRALEEYERVRSQRITGTTLQSSRIA